MQTGRRIICSLCARFFVRGQSRVRRFVVFHFCANCLNHRQQECASMMIEATK
jgi:hypothetical protein